MRQAGVDMIYLSAKPEEFRLKDAAAFTHQQTAKKYGDAPEIWGYSATGQPLTGKLFVNRGKGGYAATVNVNGYGLTAQFNPSKMQHPYELTADISAPIEAVKDLFQSLSIDVDTETMKLTRVDLTKQAIMRSPIESFTGAFGALNGKRMKQRTQYPDGFQVGNGQRQVVFYDKHREQLLNEPSIIVPENLLRCEARFMKDAIGNSKNGLGLGFLKDLIKADPEHLTEAYNRNLLTNVFRTSNGVQLSLDYGTEIDILTQYLSAHKSPKTAVNAYIITAGVEHILNSFGNITHFRQVLLNLGVSRATAYRIEAGISKHMEQKRFLDRARNQKTTVAAALDTLIKTFAA